MAALAVAWCLPAMAEPSATELAVARKLFGEAVELERAERWELAASKLRDALAVKDTPGLRFHLAHCEEKQGRLVEAMLNYDRARELIAAGAKAPDVENVLEPARAQLERRLPQLMIVPPADVADLTVQVDGKPVARAVLGRAAPVDVGSHRIVARAKGFRDYVNEVPIAEGERRTVQLDLTPLPVAVPAKSPARASNARVEDDDTSSPTRTYVLLGETVLTVAALGVGIGYWVAKDEAADRVKRSQDVIDTNSDEPKPCAAPISELVKHCADLDRASDDHQRALELSIVGFTAAGVGAAATVLTYLLWPTTSVTPSAKVGERGSWFGVSGRF